MHALEQARTAYANSAAPIKTFRSAEYDAFTQITSRMKSAIQKGKRGFTDLANALYDNNRLWVLLASDVADKENGLPQSLRAQVFYLAEFTLQHAPKVLRGTETADILVEINTSIMRGLRQSEVAA